jgi:predicted alpha-1,6-mannanase (GH76 family)
VVRDTEGTMRLGWILAVVLCGVSARAQSDVERAAQGVKALQGWYDASRGLYKTTGWWNSGNATTVLVDYSRVSGSTEYLPVLANTLIKAQNKFPGFLNDYYDDEGWWALAWVDAYDLTGDKAYLAMAESIFADMTGAWDETCGGGIWWSREKKYKNAIANELFLSVAAHLANRDGTRHPEYVGWASGEWAWFAASGMVNDKGLVNDGLKIDPVTKVCRNNGQRTWSYNQGVVLGGLAELSKLNGDAALPAASKRIALAAIAGLSDKDGVLHDACEPKCGADGSQFKGIFVRNLGELEKAYPDAAYEGFIRGNAAAVWEKARGDGARFGVVWSGPYGEGDASTTSSGLDALVAAAFVEKR